ncbi:hypothetical protein KEM09_14260 [Carboxylicivirga mesophila]|uniref:histidine kinase n=1 Tax=Carboxylicivirga mesophila TaxID=1166478 RepID=A0ABS5KCH4_9BACT|nr:ATP-binding protein [Carboxylicivirga mesophila]MBS2212577.1 hypothetical protein [Carboxylicivirga mesophila]
MSKLIKIKLSYKRIPFEYRLSVIYLIVGCLWILFSDQLAGQLSNDEETLRIIQLYKGWFYVLITAIALLLFVKEHLKRLRYAENLAKENEQLKTAFIENMSHELRTPMNAIVGFTEIARTEGVSMPEMRQYLDIILNSSKQLLSIVNDVMDTSLLESGNVVLKNEQFTLQNLIENVHAYFSPVMKDNVSLLTHTEGESFMVCTDREKMTRIFHNLVNNAIKFTHRGRIEIGYRIGSKDVVFFVKDTGVGIDPAFHQSIFDRFKQAEIELSKRTGGTGLGLSICKEMMKLLGGQIWLESEVGAGSKFYFSLPINTLRA